MLYLHSKQKYYEKPFRHSQKEFTDLYSTKYDNLMVTGDLNAEVNLERIKLFCETYDLKGLTKVPICYDNPEKPSCIDLLLTNRLKSFLRLGCQISIRCQ